MSNGVHPFVQTNSESDSIAGQMNQEKLIEEYFPNAVERAQRTALLFGLDPNEAISAALSALRKGAEFFKPVGTANFSTYANKCIHNALLDLLKKEKLIDHHFVSESALEFDEFENFLDAQPGSEVSPSTEAAMQESGKILRVAADELKENDRQVIELVWEGRKTSEIAQILGCSKQNISYHLSRIFAELRSILAKKGFGCLDTVGLLKTITKRTKV